MTRKKIFTTINKNKLKKLYTSLLKNAIEKKEDEYKQEGYEEFNVKNDVLRVCGKITPRACKYYLQALVLPIPFEDYTIREAMLNYLKIKDDKYIDYYYNDTYAIIDQYWDGISLAFSVLLHDSIL